MKKTTKTKKRIISPFTVVASLACVILAAVVLNGYISLNELTITTNNKEKELQSIIDENELVAIQIEQKNSLANIEEIATTQLNMIKLEQYQIHTVNLAQDDSVEIVTEPEDESFIDGIVASFNILLEYLD